MDAVSYAHSAKQAQRIEKFIENPDSTSGIVTVPKTIASGETVTVPAGRVAVLPNVQVDGTLNVEGDVFIPAGATFGDLEGQIDTKQSKGELAYDVDTSSYIANTLASGAIIERGSNANGEYVKFADGTLICLSNVTTNGINGSLLGGSTYYYDHPSFPFPATFITTPKFNITTGSSSGRLWISNGSLPTTTAFSFTLLGSTESFARSLVNIVAIGRWK